MINDQIKKVVQATTLAGTGVLLSVQNVFAEVDTSISREGLDIGGSNDPIGEIFGSKTLGDTIGSFLKVGMGLLGIVAIFIILIGGFKWMTAGGNEDKIKEAKKFMFQGVIGMIIIVCAYALSSFVTGAIKSATGTDF